MTPFTILKPAEERSWKATRILNGKPEPREFRPSDQDVYFRSQSLNFLSIPHQLGAVGVLLGGLISDGITLSPPLRWLTIAMLIAYTCFLLIVVGKPPPSSTPPP
jgi:hypothetical protein